MLTVKELKKYLAHCPDDMILRTQQGEDFIHMVNYSADGSQYLTLGTAKPIGHCNRSGNYVYPSVVEGYSAYSPALDEDLYDIEWTPLENIEQ